LSAFAGRRPEEAEQTTWNDINFAEKWIRVEAQTSKIGQRRVVYPLPTAIVWLKKAKKLGAELPLGQRARKKDRLALRAELGWPTWKKDVTRHTAASNWLAVSRSSAEVAESLGHSEKVLKKHYKALITKAEAEEFWKLGCPAKPAKKPAAPAGRKKPAPGPVTGVARRSVKPRSRPVTSCQITAEPAPLPPDSFPNSHRSPCPDPATN
jgi:hypothetical protein